VFLQQLGRGLRTSEDTDKGASASSRSTSSATTASSRPPPSGGGATEGIYAALVRRPIRVAVRVRGCRVRGGSAKWSLRGFVAGSTPIVGRYSAVISSSTRST